MKTTDLYVELVVVGAGALIGVVLLFLAAVPLDITLLAEVPWPALLLLLLTLVYVVGIVADRVYDAVFHRRDVAFRKKAYETDDVNGRFDEDRRLIMSTSEQMADLMQYCRSRMRICRGWSINFILIAVGLDLYLLREWSSAKWALATGVAGTVLLLVLAWLSRWAWDRLAVAGYKAVRLSADLIRSSTGDGSAATSPTPSP